MSINEERIYAYIQDFRNGKLSRKEVALKIGCSERTVTRKAKRIRDLGLAGVKHGNSGRMPSNKISSHQSDLLLNLYRNKYKSFNFHHAFEMINQNNEIDFPISYSTFRKLCRDKGLGKVKKRRASKARIARERASQRGIMLQLDGSFHKWNGRDVWCLINIIDDATSQVLASEFFDGETTFAVMKCLRNIIEKFGVPEFILTDCAGWAAQTGKRAHFSQFARACEELGIKLITTPNPQSKGRVERSFRTFQDRLIAEMELLGIKSQKDGNRYLRDVYLPNHNSKFSVTAMCPEDRFKSLESHLELDSILCFKETRKVNRAHLVHFMGKAYVLTSPPKNLWNHEVCIHLDDNEHIKISYDGNYLEFKPYRSRRRVNYRSHIR